MEGEKGGEVNETSPLPLRPSSACLPLSEVGWKSKRNLKLKGDVRAEEE